MGESILVPAKRAIWVRAVIRSPGEFRVRVLVPGRETLETDRLVGRNGGEILRYEEDFVSLLIVTVERWTEARWQVCRTVQSVEDHPGVTVVWIGAEGGSGEADDARQYSEVIVAVIWTNPDVAAEVLRR